MNTYPRRLTINGKLLDLSKCERFGKYWFGFYEIPADIAGPFCLIDYCGPCFEMYNNGNRPRTTAECVFTPQGIYGHSFPATWIRESSYPAIFAPL